MQLILEMLDPQIKLYEDAQLMLEVLGNLDVIDKSLIRALRKTKPHGYSSKKEHGADRISASLGQKSEVKEEPAKNPNDVMSKLDDAGAVTIVVKLGDEQLFAIANRLKLLGDKDGGLMIVGSPRIFKAIDQDEIRQLFKAKSDYETNSTVKKVTEGDPVGITIGKAKSMIKLVFDSAKETKQPVTVLVIMKDVERFAKQAARSKARTGRVPLPDDNSLSSTSKSEYQKYIKDLKYMIAKKLETYKSTKISDKYNTPEEMLKGLIEKGFMDKIKFMDYTYDKKDYTGNFGNLIRGDKESDSYPHVSVSYELSKNSPEYKELVAKVKSVRDEMEVDMTPENKEQIWKDYEKKRKELLPPGKITVAFAFKGGVLIPSRVIFDEGYIGIY